MTIPTLRWIATAAFALVACASPGRGSRTFGDDNADLAAPSDLARRTDLAAAHPDFAEDTGDLSMAMATTPDDLAMSAPADLTVIPDLVKPPDLAGSCKPVTQPCDLVCQNCGLGKACSFDVNNNPACFTAGNKSDGQTCPKGSGDCVAGDICLGVNPNGACFRFCRVDGDCPGGGTCTLGLVGVQQKVCTEAQSNCTIVPNANCGNGTACYAVGAAGQPGCHAPGLGAVGAACKSDYDCLGGYACFMMPMGCQKLCRAGNNGDCPNGKACKAVQGWMNGYGLCN